MLTTPNLRLRKPEANDTVNIADLNYNADVLDQEVAKRIINSGGVPSIQAGPDAEKPAPGIAGRLYVATDTQMIYRDTGTAWQKVGAVKWNDIEGKPALALASDLIALASNLTAHATDTEKHITSAERTAWNNKLDASAYTAADILAKLKTVDGAGSGLDADTVDGKHFTDILSTIGAKITGSVTYNESVPGDTTVTKNINLGDTYKKGTLIVRLPDVPNSATNRRCLFFFDTDPINIKGISSHYNVPAKTYDAEVVTRKTNSTLVGAPRFVHLKEAWIDGNYLKITFVNTDSSIEPLNCTIYWEVEK